MKNKRKRWKNGVILIPVLCVLLLTGCGLFQEKKIKLRDLDFTVLSDEKIPEELKTVIVEKGTEPFHLTYSDDQNLYISIGYGQQKTGGYSIAVDELYLTEENIHVAATLIGPEAANKKNPTPTYPMIVLKTPDLGKPVIFQ